MNSSFLYHAWGLYSLECTKEEYKGKKNYPTCPKQKAIIRMPEVRKAPFSQEWVPFQRLYRSSHRWKESDNPHEGTTLQMQE